MAAKDFDTHYRQLIKALEANVEAGGAFKQKVDNSARDFDSAVHRLDQNRTAAFNHADQTLNATNEAFEAGRSQLRSVGLSESERGTFDATRVEGVDVRMGLNQAQQRARASLTQLQAAQRRLLEIRAANGRRRYILRRIALGIAIVAIVTIIGAGIYLFRAQATENSKTTTPTPSAPTQVAATAPATQQSTGAAQRQVSSAALADAPSATAIAGTTLATASTETTAVAAMLGQTATAFAPSAPTVQAGLAIATSDYAPEIEATLLKNGYDKNIVAAGKRHGLGTNPSGGASIWARDLDYASTGYGYVLGDMNLLKQSIELFLQGVKDDGVVPDQIVLNWEQPYVTHQAWDSMPNLIHAVYAYVAKTGDLAFYQQHRDTLQQVGGWIAGLDVDGDGLPDPERDNFPYGYYNSVTNSARHTYALAKFYAAFNELAELEQYSGHDQTLWANRAASLRAGFHRSENGYWPDGQAWPVAWFRRTDNSPVTVLETFGVFEALRSGLIAPSDGARYQNLIQELHARMPDLTSGPNPMRLALGGYPADVLRHDITPSVPVWMLNASAPWIVGLAAPAYAAAGHREDASAILKMYMEHAQKAPLRQFAAEPNPLYGDAQQSNESGASWDSAAWFLAVYGGHYGLTMTPAALIVQPHPFETLPDDSVHNLSYQGAVVQLTLDAAHLTYRIQADRPITVILRPMGDAQQLHLDNDPPSAEVTILLQPEHEYVVVGEPVP
jgi:hypothetical protein